MGVEGGSHQKKREMGVCGEFIGGGDLHRAINFYVYAKFSFGVFQGTLHYYFLTTGIFS